MADMGDEIRRGLKDHVFAREFSMPLKSGGKMPTIQLVVLEKLPDGGYMSEFHENDNFVITKAAAKSLLIDLQKILNA